jgi:2-(1,2-epoxy-1,2-dihydrophenyl)acetyl-CoA isomerase
MPSDLIRMENNKDGVCVVILNNVEKRNAINTEAMDELTRTLRDLQRNDEVRVIVLKGQGDHFCAGADLTSWKEYSTHELVDKTRQLSRPIRQVQQMETPVIAMVKGYAVGGGMSLALACDMVFAADDARFSANFLKLAIVPDLGGMCFLPIAAGLSRAKELFFRGNIVDATEAAQLGIVNRVFPKESLEEETMAIAREIAEMPRVALGLTKRILNAAFLDKLDGILEHEAHAQPLCAQSEEHKKMIMAFIQSRNPKS